MAWTSIFGNRFIYIRVVCACTYNFIGLSLDNCRSSFVQQFYRFSSSVSILFPLAMREPLFFFSLSLFCSLSIYVLRFSSFVSDNCLWPVQFLVSHICGAPIVSIESKVKWKTICTFVCIGVEIHKQLLNNYCDKSSYGVWTWATFSSPIPSREIDLAESYQKTSIIFDLH